MKKFSFMPAAVVLAAAMLVNGCATNQANQNAGIGAAIGCAGGAAIAAMTGGKAAQGCVLGAAAGAVVGYMDGRKKDMDLAWETQGLILNGAPGTDTNVQIISRPERVPEAERTQANNETTFNAVDKMVVQVPNSLIAKQDRRASHTFGRVGGYVSTAHAPSTVTVVARNKQEFNYIVENIRKGYGPNNPEPHKVRYVFSQLTRGSQASVEVAHA